MSTYTRIVYQLVFGSKEYTSFLTSANQDLLFKYIAGILLNKKCHPYIVGGYKNHIHIVCDLHPSISLSDLVRDLKTSTGIMMKESKSKYPSFPGWQAGYGAFTYSSDSINNLMDYVGNQALHHKRKSFKEELIEFCKDQGVPFDDRYFLK